MATSGARVNGRRALGAIAAAVAGVAIAAGVAGAVDSTVDFEDLPPGTEVGRQYEAKGVVFGSQDPDPFRPNIVADALANGDQGAELERRCPPRQLCESRADGILLQPATRITMRVFTVTPGTADNSVAVRGFSDDGELQASSQVFVAAGGDTAVDVTLTLGRTSRPMTRFSLLTETKATAAALPRIAFDDLTFDRPAPTTTTTTPTATTPTTTTPTTTTTTPAETTPAPPPPPPPAPAPSPPPPPPAPAPGDGPEPQLALAGPDAVSLGEPARFVAGSTPNAERHEWDLDGDGSYETDTAEGTSVTVRPSQGATYTIGVRATFRDGVQRTAARPLRVRRSPVIGLQVSPPTPRPGQTATLRLKTRTDGTRFRLFSWKIKGVAPQRDSVKVPAVAGGTARTVTLKDAQPTTVPQLRRSFPKAGVFDVEITAVDSTGETTKLYETIGVAKNPAKRDAKGTCGEGGPAVFASSCASMAIQGTPATGFPLRFVDTTPDGGFCTPSLAPAGGDLPAAYVEALDLPYPDPTASISQEGVVQVGAKAIGSTARTRGDRRARAAQKDCKRHPTITQKWEIGPDTVITGPEEPQVVQHTFTAPGTYTVKLTTERSFAGLRREVTRTEKVTIVDPVCGPLLLRGATVRSAVFAPGSADQPLFDQGATGCWTQHTVGDKKVFRPFSGYAVDLGGVLVRSPEAFVDPAGHTIGTLGEPLRVEVSTPLISKGRAHVGTHPQIVVPPPALVSPGLKPDNTPLPKIKAASLKGLLNLPQAKLAEMEVVGGDVHLKPGKFLAVVKADLVPPKPIGNGHPSVVIGGQPFAGQSSTAAQDAETDFELDLGGRKIGEVEVKELKIAHRKAGGWYGGGTLIFPDFGSVAAPYRRPPATRPDTCLLPAEGALKDKSPEERVAGPSGLSIDTDGSFEFAGLAVLPKPAKLVIGPVQVNCLAVSGTKDPFLIEGRTDLQVPPSSPDGKTKGKFFAIQGCLFLAILKAQQPAQACGDDENQSGKKLTSYTAKQDLVWFHAKAKVKVMDKFDLASGYFDLKKSTAPHPTTGKDLFVIEVGAAMAEQDLLGLVKLDGGIDGAIVIEPEFDFSIYGKIKACGDLVEVISSFVSLGFDSQECARVEAILALRGIAVCGELSWLSGGATINWKDGDFDLFTGCDLSDSSLLAGRAASSAMRRVGVDAPAGMAQLGGAQRLEVKVPKGLPFAAIDIRGSGNRPPGFIVRGPGGKVIRREARELDIAPEVEARARGTLARGLVRLARPASGTWTVEALPGSTLTGAALAMPKVAPRISAKVSSAGDGRRKLTYTARLSDGDVIEFREKGALTERVLGTTRGGKGTLTFSAAEQTPGRRTIVAVLKRRGFAIRTQTVATHRVAAPKTLPAPAKVQATSDRKGLAISWAAVPGARGYVVRVKTGRREHVYRVRGRRMLVPDVADDAAAKVQVLAYDRLGREGTRRADTLEAVKRPVRLTL